MTTNINKNNFLKTSRSQKLTINIALIYRLMSYHLRRVRKPNARPQVRVLWDDREVDLVGVLVVDPLGEVVASLGRDAAVARELPLTAAEVEDGAGVVADALLHLKKVIVMKVTSFFY